MGAAPPIKRKKQSIREEFKDFLERNEHADSDASFEGKSESSEHEDDNDEDAEPKSRGSKCYRHGEAGGIFCQANLCANQADTDKVTISSILPNQAPTVPAMVIV